jgi:Family of unknown function (DUF6884)
LYASPLFQLSLRYAKTICPDVIYILSAKHGLVDLDTTIEPYNVTLNEMTTSERKTWAEAVVAQLGKRTDIMKDHFVLLAGQNYRRHVIPYLQSFELPLEGLSIGKQLQFLSRKLSS